MTKDFQQMGAAMPPLDDKPLWDAWLSINHLYTVMMADEVDLFEALEQGPLGLDALCEKVDLQRRSLEAVLAVLVSLGYVAYHLERYSNTMLSKYYLLKSSPYYWGGLFAFIKNIHFDYNTFRTSMRKDRSSLFDKERDIWETHTVSPEQARVFTSFMHSHAIGSAMGLSRMGYFSGVKKLLDIGGGSGIYSISFALAHPELTCTIVDRTTVCEEAQKNIVKFACEKQVKTVVADIFNDDWPADHDGVFLSDIFHDWKPEANLALAKRAFDVLPSGGRIFVHEILLDLTRRESPTPAFYSVAMAVTTEGKQYNDAELRETLEGAGFVDVQVRPGHGYYSLISAAKP